MHRKIALLLILVSVPLTAYPCSRPFNKCQYSSLYDPSCFYSQKQECYEKNQYFRHCTDKYNREISEYDRCVAEKEQEDARKQKEEDRIKQRYDEWQKRNDY